MNGVYIIQGRPSIGANLMAAAVKRSGRYNYRVVEMSETRCALDFYEGKEKIGSSVFTLDDAHKAGTKNLEKFPRNMLFARAISNGVRWYCPDVFNGSTVYTPEELGATVNEEGDIIDIPPQPPQPPAPQIPVNGGSKHDAPLPNHPAPAAAKMSRETAEDITNRDGKRYGEIDNATLSYMANSIASAMKQSGKTVAEKETYQIKLDAIAVILEARAEDDARAADLADSN